MVLKLTALAVSPLLAAAASLRPSSCSKLDGLTLPHDFIYGCGTSAYQIEGAYNIDGKGESIWDNFVMQNGGNNTKNGDTGQVAMDFYHTYRKDIPLFKKALGVNNYDFTLSWTRILPEGTGTQPNDKGVGFYKDMIKTVHDNDMSASCTLYHWDLPQVLQTKYKGWMSADVVKDFENYARVTMTALGGDCDRWISMNEPRTFCTEGYAPDAESAPGLKGDALDPFKCMHNALLAHSAAHKVFQELKSQGKVKGTFGIKADGGYSLPLDPNSKADHDAVERAAEFEIGWVIAPLTTGDYPPSLRQTLGDKLPKFTAEESTALKDSYDVVWYDGYTRAYAGAIKGKCEESNEDASWPTCVVETSERDGKPIGVPTGSDWNFLVPETLYSGLKYMHERWGVMALAVGETGLTLKNRSKHSKKWQLNDDGRIEWYKNSLKDVKRAIQEKMPLVGFVPWSCISNFEWSNGFEADFGLIYAEPGINQPRFPKLSSMYLKDVLTAGVSIDSPKYKRGSKIMVSM